MSLRFARLTRPNIRPLKPGARITEHGISAKRTRNGDTCFSINVMVDGRRIHRVIGYESDGTTRTQAEDYVAQVRSDAKAGRLSLPKGRKTRLAFSRAAADYISKLEETGGRNLVAKRRHLRFHFTPFFGSQRLDSITDFTIDRYKKAAARRRAHQTEPSILSWPRCPMSSARPSSGDGLKRDPAASRSSLVARAGSSPCRRMRRLLCSKRLSRMRTPIAGSS